MTNDKGKQFLLRVTPDHIAEGLNSRDSCTYCPAAHALNELFSTERAVRTQKYDGVTARLARILRGGDLLCINSDALDKEIHKFDSGGSFPPGLYLCEVV